jgi:hypothetical protein
MIAVIERSTAPQNAANTTSNASVSTSAAPKVVSWLFFGAPASVRPIILSIIINSFLSTVDQCYQSSKDRVLGASSIWVILVWLGRYLGAARCIGGLELRRMLLPRSWVNSAMANPSACRPSPRRPPRRSAPSAAKRTPSCRRSTERVARERPDRSRCRAVTLTWGSTLLNVPPAARPCPARRGAAWPRRPPGHALGGTPRRRRA